MRLLRVLLAATISVIVAFAVGCGARVNKPGPSSVSASGSERPTIAQDGSLKQAYSRNLVRYMKGLDPKSVSSAPALGSCGDLAVSGAFTPKGCNDGTYVVVQVVNMPKECVADVNNRYIFGSDEDGVFYTGCLDLNWAVANCLSLAEGSQLPAVVGCENGGQRFRGVNMQFDSSGAVGSCGSFESMFYSVRKFLVCYQSYG